MTEFSSEKTEIIKVVESSQEKFWKISDAIWSYAELGLEEYKSSKLLADTLEDAGFTVDRGVAGMPTAFVASWSWGTGQPTIGFLGEFDALPMLSQKAGAPEQIPLVPGGPGHGCGHNTMGTMQALAVVSLKAVAEKTGLDCTIKYFGTPAEEILVAKPHFIRAGLFKEVDVVLDCHTMGYLGASYGKAGVGMYSFTITFRGKTAHSGADPWKGRSAADAVELMHAGTERMREHLPPTQRTHWVTTDGGEAPNVVPDKSITWYYIRDIDDNLENHFDWIMDCAKGAALMTQTTYEVKVLSAIHQQYSNKALAEIMFENAEAVGLPNYTEEEQAFARAIQEETGSTVKGLEYEIKLNDSEKSPVMGFSSDVGDVTLVAPCATLGIPTRVPGEYPGHHWAVVSGGSSSIAYKGITTGAKVNAGTAYDLLTKPESLAKIRREFELLAREHPYQAFLPDDAKPPLGWNTELMVKYQSEMEKYYVMP